MATIRAAIALYDGVTGPLQHMNRAMNIVLNSFEAMQGACGRAVDVTSIHQAREELARTETAMDGIEESIRRNREQQQGFNNDLRSGSSAAGGLWSKLRGVVAVVGGLAAARKAIDLSDQIAGGEARLSLIVDDGGSVAELEQKIMASAQRSRAGYLDTMQSVSKLGLLAGDAFGSNDEMIRFAELMNKNFVIAGASQQEQASAMYQLNQALGSGRLQGDEYRSIIENAPLLAQAIEDYMRNVQGAEGSMKEWSSEGLLTAEVIKNALFSSADEVEARFEQMPKTWGQVWTEMKNKALSIFNPTLQRMNDIANSDRFEAATNGILNGLAAVATLAGFLFGIIVDVGAAFTDNWSLIAPIIWGIVAAMIAYNAVMGIGWFTTLKHIAGKVAHAAASAAETAAIIAMTAAQNGLNAALALCPLTWIILLIIALVAIFYAAIAAVNHFAGTSISATGLIAGAFMTALAFVGNLFVGLFNLMTDVFVMIRNLIAEVANFIGNVFTDPVGAVARLFFGLADTVLGILEALSSAIDAVFGLDLGNSVRGLRDSLGGWVDSTFGKGKEIMEKVDSNDMHLGRFEYGAAFDLGYQLGEGIEDKVGGLFNFDAMDTLGAADFGNMMDGIYGNTGEIAGNTAASKDALEISGEDLKYLRDIAEREAINRYTTAQITVEQHNENHIDRDADLDGIMEAWTADFAEKLDISAEGVHV